MCGGDQFATIESPWTKIALAGNGRVAGPFATEPSRLNRLPWHGQLIVPSATLFTVQPAWVQIADNPLNTPCVGCVSTTSPMITPEPRGTSEVLAMTVAGPGEAGVVDAGALPSTVGPDGGSLLAVGFLPYVEHAATTAANKPIPMLASTFRRSS
jgi:hypothetical protein